MEKVAVRNNQVVVIDETTTNRNCLVKFTLFLPFLLFLGTSLVANQTPLPRAFVYFINSIL